MCGQENYGDGGTEEKNERKTEAGVDGYHQQQLVGERIVRGGSARPEEEERELEMGHTDTM